MNPRVFRDYDIRGNAERDLDDEFVGQLGRAIGTHLGRAGARRITLGRDCRLHSPRLHAALLPAILSTGLDVIDVGVVASPLLYYSVLHFGADGGVQITGSHNPPDDNGFKIVRGRSSIHGEEIAALRELIVKRDFVTADEPGLLVERAVDDHYLDMAASRIELGPRRFKVVVDAGNGTGGVAAELLRRLGFDVTALHCDPDGHFPHHHPDPTVEANLGELIAKVAEVGAELGVALDGDADRIGVVDAGGRVWWGDQLMILFARSILQEVPGATFVGEVKCTGALYDEIARAGGRALMWKAGHSPIKEKMREEGALLGGELSGHIFFAHRYHGYDDAIYAAARLVELLSKSALTLAEHAASLPRLYNTPEQRRPIADERKLEVVRQTVARLQRTEDVQVIDIDGARLVWPENSGGGWALVRASNTQAALSLRFEARTAARLAELQKIVNDAFDFVMEKS